MSHDIHPLSWRLSKTAKMFRRSAHTQPSLQWVAKSPQATTSNVVLFPTQSFVQGSFSFRKNLSCSLTNWFIPTPASTQQILSGSRLPFSCCIVLPFVRRRSWGSNYKTVPGISTAQFILLKLLANGMFEPLCDKRTGALMKWAKCWRNKPRHIRSIRNVHNTLCRNIELC